MSMWSPSMNNFTSSMLFFSFPILKLNSRSNDQKREIMQGYLQRHRSFSIYLHTFALIVNLSLKFFAEENSNRSEVHSAATLASNTPNASNRTTLGRRKATGSAIYSEQEPILKKGKTISDGMYSLKPKVVQFDKVWDELRPSIIDIINLRPITNVQWHHKFSDVYDICVSIPTPLSERLYQEVKTCVKQHVQEKRLEIVDVDPDLLLQEYHKMWRIFHEGAIYIHRLFGYLNKQFVKQKRCTDLDNFSQYAAFLQIPDIKEIGCLALEIWKEELVKYILPQLVQLLLVAIDGDRKGNLPNAADVVSGVINSFVKMEETDFEVVQAEGGRYKVRESITAFYQESFEKPLLADTEMYYSALAQKMLSELSCSEYMEQVILLLEQEEVRAKKYLHESSVEKVITLCQKVMIKAHKEKLHAVCHDLITNEENKDLRNMYRLLKPIQAGLSVMVKEFEEYVKKKGLEAIAQLSGDNVPQQFVENVLKVYNKFNDMKTVVFMDDGEFSSGLDKALQGVVNSKEQGQTVPKASERLARYTDSLLKKTTKGLSETDLEVKLGSAIVIFRYIEDKDVFQKFYSKMLANRLIAGSSVSMDAEELMINKLKQACGYEFTSKLSRMFTDIGLSHELSTNFDKHISEIKEEHPEKKSVYVPTQTLILQAGSWPLNAPQVSTNSSNSQTALEVSNFHMPMVLLPVIQEFENFYTGKHNGRKITWLFNMSQGDVRLTYLDKQYVVQVYVYQMAALLCFERRDSIVAKEIGEEIGVSGDYLLKTLRTIVDASILTCDDPNLTSDSILNLNKSMSQKRIKFRLQAPQVNKAVEKEQDPVANTVSQDRKYYMECAIVRIMKTRKVLKHNALVTEIMDQTKGRFSPDVPFIKKSIEDLIEKMYIQRTDQNDEYQYLA
uniref:Cullin-2 n=1 Tax=Caenorhabditis tropicalis TaxID=1561998 RepID=A0A1I7TM21_9PELO